MSWMRWLNRFKREFSRGDVRVALAGRTGLRYRDGAKVVTVPGELLMGKSDFVIYPGCLTRWDGTHEPIDETERRRIVKNIQEICAANDVRIEVQR